MDYKIFNEKSAQRDRLQAELERPGCIARQAQACRHMITALRGRDVIEIQIMVREKTGRQHGIYSVPDNAFSPASSPATVLIIALEAYSAQLNAEFSAL